MTTCKTHYEFKLTYVYYVDSRAVNISGERNVLKELVTMPLGGFGVKIMTDRLCMTLAVDK